MKKQISRTQIAARIRLSTLFRLLRRQNSKKISLAWAKRVEKDVIPRE